MIDEQALARDGQRLTGTLLAFASDTTRPVDERSEAIHRAIALELNAPSDDSTRSALMAFALQEFARTVSELIGTPTLEPERT